MSGIRIRLHNSRKIRVVISISLVVLSALLVYFLGEMAGRSSEDAILQNYQATYKVALSNSSRVLDMNLRSILEVVRGYLTDDEVRTVLTKDQEPGGTFSAPDREILEAEAKQLLMQQALVNDVIFFSLTGNHYMLSNTRGSYEFDVYYKTHDYLEEPWSRDAEAARGKEVFFGNDVLGPDLGNVLCMAKYLIDPRTGSPMGYLVVTLSRKLIGRSYVGGGSDPASRFLVLSDNHELIYYEGPEEQEEAIRAALLEWEQVQKAPKTLVFSDVQNGTTGWKLVNAARVSDLTGQSRQLRNMVWIVGSIVFLLILAFIRVTLQNNLLSEHLMATKLNEREAELLLLQSQINPHFLYNTLDALYFQAVIHGDDQIADATMALSNHFRLTLNRGSNFITIRDNLQWIREYMKIMNFRFHDRFELVEKVDEALLDYRILTFILQPFVENAINHGLEAKIGKGVIEIAVRSEQELLILEIRDDGAGMEDISVWETGYGVRNVQERIRLHYGNFYGASVKSSRAEGTLVTVKLPLVFTEG